jgi:hypothetical protein
MLLHWNNFGQKKLSPNQGRVSSNKKPVQINFAKRGTFQGTAGKK